ncbi:MAG TPA: peptidoglycan-binding domain-containing protein [Gaiellaceae bacterium]|nr:peptidoglycan-binding domain-containing protein [Gaiellaceae bacterium]
MEAREEPHDPGYDDWFDEPEPPTQTQSGANRSAFEDVEEVWVLPGDEDSPGPGQHEIVIAGRTLTLTQVAIVGVSLLALLFASLAAAGVFNGGAGPAPPVALPKKPPTPKVQTPTPAVTTPAVQAPAQTLSPGDTGAQVKILQKALAKLGFSPGTPDGDYGPATQVAVERFQVSKGLAEDGVVGPQTLNAIQKALAG